MDLNKETKAPQGYRIPSSSMHNVDLNKAFLKSQGVEDASLCYMHNVDLNTNEEIQRLTENVVIMLYA